jgi:hypothetical protein
MAEKKDKNFNLYAYTLEIGFRISIPLIIFILAGIWFDKKLGTGHLCLFAGIGLSLSTSAYGIKQTIDNLRRDQ